MAFEEYFNEIAIGLGLVILFMIANKKTRTIGIILLIISLVIGFGGIT